MEALSTALVAVLAADPRLVWSGPGVSLLGAPSRDGAYLTTVDPKSHAIARKPLGGPQIPVPIIENPHQSQYAYFSVPSRDGRRVAYAWFNEAGFYELRVGTKTVYRNEEAGFVQPTAWTPGDRAILTLFFRRDNTSLIALVDARTGEAKPLRSLNWVYPKKMDLSPDGRWIVYDTFAGPEPGPRDIYLLSVDGGKEIKLTDHPADDLFPLFSPDGREIVFASDRRERGTLDLYTLPVDQSRPPKLLRQDMGRYLPLGVTDAGHLYYGRRTSSATPQVEIVGQLTGHAALVARRPATENYGLAAGLLHVNEGAVWTPLDLKLAHLEKARWSPDGKRILVSGIDGKGRTGLFCTDPAGKAIQTVVTEEYGSARGVEGVWLDSDRIAYAIQGAIRERRLSTGEDQELAPIAARSLAARQGRLAAATADEVVILGGLRWPVKGIEQVEWSGDKELLVTRGSAAARLDAKGAHKVDLPRFKGQPLTSAHDHSAIVYAVDEAREEVWVLEHVWPPARGGGR